MEGALILLVLLLLAAPLAFVVWIVVRTSETRKRIEELSLRLGLLERDLAQLRKPKEDASKQPAPTPAGAVPKPPEAAPARPPSPPPAPIPAPTPQPAVPPPIPPRIPVTPPSTAPALVAAIQSQPKPPVPLPKPAPAINWEQFMGVKLFAWIAGFALFLGVAFFIKYSFDRNWITPELRATLGFIAGISLLAGGVVVHRYKGYIVGAQALCATGIVILYTITFACRTYYHFPFFTPVTGFVLMTLITTTAFLLSIRLNAMVVALLGMLGGFLTPILVSTGEDHPLGLFGYITLLDAGLILVALNRRWYFLTALSAAGTALMQFGWADEFFVKEEYFQGDKILIALAVLLWFNLIYLVATAWTERGGKRNAWLSASTLGLAGVALIFALWFINVSTVAHRPWLILGFVFLIDVGIAVLVLLDEALAIAQALAGLVIFGLLAIWTTRWLNNDLLNAALAFYFIFAVLHSVFPIYLQRRRKITAPLWGSQVFPPLALALVLIPIFQLTDLSFFVWPIVLMVDVLAIGLAVLTVSILPVIAVLLLTLVAMAGLIFKIPETLDGLSLPLTLIGAFAVFFVVAGVWLTRRFKPDALSGGIKLGDDILLPGNLAAQLPALSVVLPFLLLMMVMLRLPLANPSPVFGLALLLVVLLLGVTRLFSLDWMPAVGLVCVTALEATWHFRRFDPTAATLPLTWYLVFYGVFTLFPFLFIRGFSGKVVPWATAAMSGPLHFLLVYRLVKEAWPNEMMGLVPAAFAIPALVCLFVVRSRVQSGTGGHMAQLAWFGGVTLFFITLIFPIQFQKQWITIGWAMEGAALLWLFLRVPHRGLQFTGVGLLTVAFVRLMLLPEVLNYYPRGQTPIFNWYLYSYGMVIACLFAGAALIKRSRNSDLERKAPGVLVTLATILAFVLMNIEIADFFSPEGALVDFEFRGNFTRDMTYSIAWALFALTLLVIGIVRKVPPFRYSATALLLVTLIKLFVHDLVHLSAPYRIGAFIGVAVIVFLASFAYQRFFAASLKESEAKNETGQ